MKINIKEIYNKNIYSKIKDPGKLALLKHYSEKETEMWAFTLILIKDIFPKETIDSDSKNDMRFLKTHLDIYLSDNNPNLVLFSIDEWIDFLSKNK